MASILISDDSEPESDSDNLPPFPHNSKSLMAVRTNVPSMRSEESPTKRGRKRKATENEVHGGPQILPRGPHMAILACEGTCHTALHVSPVPNIFHVL